MTTATETTEKQPGAAPKIAENRKTQEKKSNRKIWFLVLIPLMFVAIPAVRLIFFSEEVQTVVKVVPVRVSTPSVQNLEYSLEYPGTITAETTATAVPKVAGRIERVYIEEGQQVEAGDLLVSIETEVLQLQADQARAAWLAAKAQLEKGQKGAREQELENTRALVDQAEDDLESAETNLERTKRLYDAGTVAKADYEDAQNAVASARTQVNNARRNLTMMEEGASDEDIAMLQANEEAALNQYRLAQLQLSYADVSAPVSGTVARLFVEEGNSVGQTSPVAAIINDSFIYAKSAVPEKHYQAFILRPEYPVRIFPIAFNSRYTGTTTTVSPVIDPTSRTFEVKTAVKNEQAALRPGMFVNMQFVMDLKENAVTLPDQAVLLRDGNEVVFIASEETNGTVARLQRVTTGMKANGVVQITEGVSPEDRVIVEGNSFLEDGQSVRLTGAER